MKEYVTKSGDMWDSCAKEIYGSEKYVRELIESNPEYHEYGILPAGIRLFAPDIKPEVSATLPKWKRGKML